MKLFKTKRLGEGRKREATAVIINPFDVHGKPINTDFGQHVPDWVTNPPKPSKKRYESIVTIFSGSDGGKSEAEKLCEMLNFAYDCFHNGKPLTDGEEKEYIHHETVTGRSSHGGTIFSPGDNDRYHG